MPCNVRNFKVLAATAAPVCPALTTASARPSRTMSVATAIDEFFFRRIALTALSVMSTTSVASMISIRRSESPMRACSARNSSGRPTR